MASHREGNISYGLPTLTQDNYCHHVYQLSVFFGHLSEIFLSDLLGPLSGPLSDPLDFLADLLDFLRDHLLESLMAILVALGGILDSFQRA